MTGPSPPDTGDQDVNELAWRYALPRTAPSQLSTLRALLATDPLAPTGVREPQAILRDHLADSLAALELSEVRDASTIADVGSGAGLPGLPLAIALPETPMTLIESRRPKSRFISHAASACDLTNVEVVHSRVEERTQLREAFDAVTARALGPLDVVAEYAAPLLRDGGALVTWRGRRDAAAEAAASRAGEILGLRESRIVPVKPYPEVRERHLYVMVKVRVTPERFPRRPGLARRRPLGAEI